MVVLLSISLNSIVYPQDSSKSSVKWGVGISSPVFFTSSYQFIIPPAQNTSISVPVFIKATFKLEPFISFSDYQYENEYKPATTTTTDRNETKYRFMTVGLGIFYSWPIKKTNVHFGGKLGYIKSQYEYIFEGSGFSSSNEDKGSGYLLSPAVGGEYFFSDHFSLGGELNFEWTSVDSDGEDRDNSNVRESSSTVKRFSTGGIVNIRVYFN
jgi:hypothetical protein